MSEQITVPEWLTKDIARWTVEGKVLHDWSIVNFAGLYKPPGWDRNDPNDVEPLAIVVWVMTPEQKSRSDADYAKWREWDAAQEAKRNACT